MSRLVPSVFPSPGFSVGVAGKGRVRENCKVIGPEGLDGERVSAQREIVLLRVTVPPCGPTVVLLPEQVAELQLAEPDFETEPP